MVVFRKKFDDKRNSYLYINLKNIHTIFNNFITTVRYLLKLIIGSPRVVQTRYRTTNMIIQTILEGILRTIESRDFNREGIIKSHLIKYSGLKTSTAEKYLQKMEKADYITSTIDYRGERKIIRYNITSKGKKRYVWFATILSELEM